MNQKNLFKHTILAMAVSFVSTNTSAAGFQLNEYSTSALGRAFSGEGAIGDNASVGSHNPAAMMLFNNPVLSFGAIYINPDVDIKGKSPVTGNSTTSRNIAPHAWIPNAHFIFPVNDKWAVGSSITTNYGLATEFNHNYNAGPIGGKTDLTTLNLNLSGAYRFNQHFSAGLGFNAVYADAEITRHIGELGAAIGLGLPASTTIAKLKGDDWGYGWNAGILYELDENNRYSFTYRSEVKIKFNGDYSNELPTLIPGGLGGNSIKGNLDLHLPEIWEISGYNKVAPKWAVHYSLAYTSWSQFKELKATAKDSGQVLFNKHEGFKDVFRIALGTTYYHDDHWTFRTGIAFDDSPVPAKNRSISIPDQDRFWISAGTTYAFNENASVDVGISYMHGQNVKIKEEMPLMAGSPALPAYDFKSSGSAWLAGVNFNYKF
ncbi:MAG TPA: long-chain fatty acid transporter FadL [Arsenophonus nasoniae]|uniref:long-chain fatty acid transporter FadL n=1 Tax=Arsenophonus nasoniae TaxID=638 RepID=UPI00387951E3